MIHVLIPSSTNIYIYIILHSKEKVNIIRKFKFRIYLYITISTALYIKLLIQPDGNLYSYRKNAFEIPASYK